MVVGDADVVPDYLWITMCSALAGGDRLSHVSMFGTVKHSQVLYMYMYVVSLITNPQNICAYVQEARKAM